MRHTYTPKKAPNGDWHRADIVAALRKAGWSVRGLCTHHGYSHPTTLNNALNRPWPKGEKIICKALREGGEYPDIQPEHLWPSRYFNKPNSTPKKRALHGKNKGVN